MTKEPNSNEFIIPRNSIRRNPQTNWFYKEETGFSLLGYIFYKYYEVSLGYLDGHVYPHHLSDKTGEAYKGFSKFIEKEERNWYEPWIEILWTKNTIDEQIQCVNQYSGYKCYWEKIETNIEL